MATQVITAGMARGYEVLQRETIRYDYEKVFWNTTYGLGLVGLGWVAVKLGQIIGGAQKAAETIAEAIDNPDYATYKFLLEWVEGPRARDIPQLWETQVWLLFVLILQFRADPEAWREYKAGFIAAHPEYFKDLKGTPVVEEGAAEKILSAFDAFYARWGMVLPIGLLVGNVGVEYLRVYRLKEEIKRA